MACLHVDVYAGMPEVRGHGGGGAEALDTLELELQAALSCVV